MEKGRVIVIGGNAKSGKTTVANQLAVHGFYKISVSSLWSMTENVFGGSYSQLSENKKFCFLEYLINHALDNAANGVSVVIDMDDFLPQDIAELKNKDQIEIYFLAYPTCTVDEIKKNIKLYVDSSDWMMQISDDYLDTCAIWFDEKNKLLVDECRSNHMKLVDTLCGERRADVLNDLSKKILDQS